MNDSDYEPFQREFMRLSAALQSFKVSSSEIQAKAEAYFHILKRFPFETVVAKADTWLAHETKFPKPVEWVNTIIVKTGDPLPVMSDAESLEHHHAEQCGYERDPCRCQSCVEAGVDERPQRYVPNENADGRTVSRVNKFGRVVTSGRWIHGRELARWYEARGNFWNRCYQLGLMDKGSIKRAEKRPFGDVIGEIFKKKTIPDSIG